MAENHDKFLDYQAEWQGLFSDGNGAMGDGLCSYDKVVHQVVQSGLANEFQCRNCGAPIRLVVEWPEIIAIRCGISPHLAYQGNHRFSSFAQNKWRKADKRCGDYWVPEGIKCNKCGKEVYVLLSSGECAAHINKGKQKSVVPAYERELGAYALAMQKRYQGMR
jgi:hypothetical protein